MGEPSGAVVSDQFPAVDDRSVNPEFKDQFIRSPRCLLDELKVRSYLLTTDHCSLTTVTSATQ
jgi:hypothetical protein